MMTSTIRKFGVGVASLALVAGVSAPAFADPGFDPSPFFNVENLRVSGADRVGTAIAYAKTAFADKSSFGGRDGSNEKVAYLAGYDNPADSATAGSLEAPIFLAKADGSSNKDIIDALNFLNVTKVIALGGEKAVPQEVLTAIAKGANNAAADRLGGADRYETSVKIAERWSANHSQFTPNKVVLANGITLVDALTAGTLNWPILLVDEQGKLPQSVLDYLNTVKPLDYITVGGEKVVPEQTVKNAQAASLKSDEISTDDSLPILKEKAKLWKTRIDGGTYIDSTAGVTRTYKGFRVEAKEAEDLAANAMEKKNEAWNKVARAAKKLGDAVSDAYKSNNKLPGNAGDTWAQYVAGKSDFATPTTAVVEARDALQTVMSEQYNTTDIDLTKPGQVAKYLHVTREGVTAQETALASDFVNDAVQAANKQANIYYRNNQQSPQKARQALKDNSSLAYLIMAEGSADIYKTFKDDKTYYDLGANAFQAAGVAQNAKELTAGNLVSAENTLRAINLKIAGVADQLDGKSYWRIAGKDRYGTAAGVSARLNNLQYGADPSKDAEISAPQVRKIYLVNGAAFADATVAGATSAPVLLIAPDGVTVPKVTHDEIIRAAKDYRDQNRILEIWAVGGRKVVSDAALQATNATAVIAQPNLYKDRGEVTKTKKDEVKYTADKVYLKKTQAALAVTLKSGKTVVQPAKITDLKINDRSYELDSNGTLNANDSHPGVTFASKTLSVSTSDTNTGTYTITFNADGVPTTVEVEVIAKGRLTVGSFKNNDTSNVAAATYDADTKTVTLTSGDTNGFEFPVMNTGVAAQAADYTVAVTDADGANATAKLSAAGSAGKVTVTSAALGTQNTGEFTVKLTAASGKEFADGTMTEFKVKVVLPGTEVTIGVNGAAGVQHLPGIKVADLASGSGNASDFMFLDEHGVTIASTPPVYGAVANEETGINLTANSGDEHFAKGQIILVKLQNNAVKWFKVTNPAA